MKIAHFLAVIALFFIASCGGDGDNPSPEATLIGTWEVQEFTVNTESTTEVSGETLISIIDIEGKDLDYSLTFSETNFTTVGAYGIEGNVEANGTTTSIDESVSNVSGDGTYTFLGDILTLKGSLFSLEFDGMEIDLSEEETIATIETLSDTELIFTQNREETITEMQGGFVFVTTIKQKGRSVWKKK